MGSDKLVGTFSGLGLLHITIADTSETALNLTSNSGATGKATVTGGSADDVITGGKANDSIDGNAGADTLDGGTGDDTLNGGAGDDVILGGASTGVDSITGGTGNDTITGGAGVDTINVDFGTDTITDFGNGVDILVASGTAVAQATMFGPAVSWTATSGTTIATGATDTDYTDVITNFVSGTDKLVLGAAGTVTTAQVDKIALAGTYHAGDVITISGVATGSVSVTSSTDLDTTGAALAAAINIASGKTVTAAYVSASDWLTLTADLAGTSFTVTAAVANTATTTVAVTETVHESAESSSGAADGTAATDTITLGGTFHAGDVITLTGYGSTVAVTAVTDAATTLAALVTAINGASATGTATLNSSTITWVQTGNAGGAHTGAGTVANAATITATDSTTTANASGNYVENLTAVTSLGNLLTAADAVLNGTVDFYFGVYAGNGYLVQHDNGTGHTNLIKLSGVTDMAFGDIIATA